MSKAAAKAKPAPGGGDAKPATGAGGTGEAALKMKNLKGIHEDDGSQNEADNAHALPVDVQVLQYVLESMGADKFEPRVVNQLLEFVHRYVAEILVDAQEYSMYSDKKDIDADDVRLAIASRLNHHYAHVPPRELMMELAEKRNSIPLPPISNEYGVRLPPMQHQLITHEDRQQLDDDRLLKEEALDDLPGPPLGQANRNFITTQQGSRNKKVSRTPIPIHISPR
ncbi:TPA: hypothetical protein N0F65_002274 [Lagenidium giganteum]|uniref:Transcription initiation factor TFIID subunit 9 n=1 Tax=Lagenidium giganteum TaxID=4803 RepID=A0AAV2YKX7_9STRA|nr:TPA: hypothetical protein N0F65_002274 [Lagenidium giganteum]